VCALHSDRGFNKRVSYRTMYGTCNGVCTMTMLFVVQI